MLEPVLTEVEKRIESLMARYPDALVTRRLEESLKNTVDSMLSGGIPIEVVAFAVAQHAAAFLSAMRMVGKCRPELADALAQDFLEFVTCPNRGNTQ